MILARLVLSFSTTLVFLILASIYVTFFYENPPLVILNDPVPTDKQQYKPGDRILVSVSADVKSQAPSKLIISWVGRTPQPIPVTEIKVPGFPVGREERTFSLAIVPQILMPGYYVLEVTSVYKVSLSPKPREVGWRSTEFEIVRDGSVGAVPVTAYLFLSESTSESQRDLLPGLEATATVPVIPESTSVPSRPVFPKPTVEIPSFEEPAIPGSAPASTATPEPTPVPSIAPPPVVLPTPIIDLPPIERPHPLPPVDPPPIFIPPLPPIDVPPIELPPVPLPPVPGRN